MPTRVKFIFLSALVAGLLLLLFTYVALAWTPLPVVNDPKVRMPGTQPGQLTDAIEPVARCGCHDKYNQAIEPSYNWQGSMMSQAARDFLFWSTMTVAGQDAIWAVGNPNATDICLRCHSPKGWLEGRSDPTNGSALTGSDFEGVQCNFCHRLYDPYFETTYAGTREGNDWVGYWDETGTIPGSSATTTYGVDKGVTSTLKLFNGSGFYLGNLPFSPTYLENGGGQYFVSPVDIRRASFADADPAHAFYYSRYHKSKYFCSTCHDVSNPVLANLTADPAQPLPTEANSAYSYYHVERTFSEFMVSAYGQQGGTGGIGPFASSVFTTSHPGNNIATCQDCHLRDVVGRAAQGGKAVIRPTGSTAHPKSGLPLHDMTGGNMWVSSILASTIAGSPNYDATNAALLNGRALSLTLNLAAGGGFDAAALLSGVTRAQQMLQSAAAIQNITYTASSGQLSFRIQNQTGHKLISGYPEGRRVFVNIKAYNNSGLVYEVNPYDAAAGTLKGLGYPYTTSLPLPAALAPKEAYVDALVFEMHAKSSLTGEDETFHFALATDRYKDNRIPPKGFNIADAAARMIQPVWHGVVSPTYFSAAEYAGGYDDINLASYGITFTGATTVTVSLYYQTTSREYIEFLRNEINGSGPLTLPETPLGVQRPTASPYIIQTDPFFNQLRGWGTTIWNLWTYNMNRPGAAPVLMAQATQNFGPTAVRVRTFDAHSREQLSAWWLLPLAAPGGILLAGWAKRRAMQETPGFSGRL